MFVVNLKRAHAELKRKECSEAEAGEAPGNADQGRLAEEESRNLARAQAQCPQ